MRLRPLARSITVEIDGELLAAAPGESVAAALFAHGLVEQTVGPGGEPRGAFCGMGVCHDCLVTIDGRAGQRACLVPVAEGMRIRRTGLKAPLESLADLAPLPHGSLPVRQVDLAVVGAGPGGLAAASVAAEAGLSVVVLDERPSPGGQYYKQPVGEESPDRQAREGAALIARARAAGAALEGGTLVWGAFRDEGGAIELGLLTGGAASVLKPGAVVLATGAYERTEIVPGWTLPGVMTTGACQTLVRAYAVAPGRRVVFAGNGPLHLQVAAELARAGGTVVAVAQASRPLAAPGLALSLAAIDPGLAVQGLGAVTRLRALGVPLLWRYAVRRIEGAGRVERVVLAPLLPDGSLAPDGEVAVEADAVCLGSGFMPSSELPRLLGCAHRAIGEGGRGELERGDDGSTSMPDVFVVGEAGGFGGAQIARAQGVLAGAAIAAAAGRPRPETGAAQRGLARARRFQAVLWRLFDAPAPPLPGHEVVVCRCEGLSHGRLREVARAEDVRDVATLKRLTRAGMGRCQGRYCAPHLQAIVGGEAAPTERDLLAPQMPLRPVPLASLAVEKPEWGGHRRLPLPELRPAAREPLPVGEAATVVIGAGIAGLSTAYYLARAGHEVVVIEAGRPNAAASGGNAGSLHVQLLSFDFGAKAEAGGSPAARTLPLQRDSVALWRAIERETGRDFEIKITGGIIVAETERDLLFLEAKTALERAHGIDCSVIGREDMERLEPALAPGFLGAAYCPEEGKVNPLVATQGVLWAAREAGARVFDETVVQRIERALAGFLVGTSRGDIRAGRIVNAAGGFAGAVSRLLGLAVPVFGAPLQMIVTEAAAPSVRGLVAHADRHLTLKQAGNGNFIVGGGWTAGLDPVHHRPRPLRASLEGNLWAAQRVVPALRKLHVLRSWAAMNVNIDGAPLLGEHPAAPGFFHAVSSNGYTLGPILGLTTAELILRGRAERDISAFGAERFG